MSEETKKQETSEQSVQNAPEQLSDILLVLDKEKMKIQAVKSIDDWKLLTLPKRTNPILCVWTNTAISFPIFYPIFGDS